LDFFCIFQNFFSKNANAEPLHSVICVAKFKILKFSSQILSPFPEQSSLAPASEVTGKTYLPILESADHALFKMVRYVLLRPLRPELDVIQNNCRVRFVGISRYVHFSWIAGSIVNSWSHGAFSASARPAARPSLLLVKSHTRFSLSFLGNKTHDEYDSHRAKIGAKDCGEVRRKIKWTQSKSESYVDWRAATLPPKRAALPFTSTVCCFG
jgi:hypothetical protein